MENFHNSFYGKRHDMESVLLDNGRSILIIRLFLMKSIWIFFP